MSRKFGIHLKIANEFEIFVQFQYRFDVSAKNNDNLATEMKRKKKSLGQHFLIDEAVLLSIIECYVQNRTCNQLLEIGPGGGALTNYLVEQPLDALLLVEKDDRCALALQKKLGSKEHIQVLNEDILQWSWIMNDRSYDIIGNFPYNISAQIVFKMIENREDIPMMIGMFQKEVADRIISDHNHKTYGILSVLTQIYYEVETKIIIEPHSFDPPPKVRSSVVFFKRRSAPLFDGDFNSFRKFVKQGFSLRRKKLKNVFQNVTFLNAETEDLRCEQLSVQDWIDLYYNNYEKEKRTDN